MDLQGVQCSCRLAFSLTRSFRACQDSIFELRAAILTQRPPRGFAKERKEASPQLPCGELCAPLRLAFGLNATLVEPYHSLFKLLRLPTRDQVSASARGYATL